MPKTGIEPIFKSYKEFVLPIKLFRQIIIIRLLCNAVFFLKYEVKVVTHILHRFLLRSLLPSLPSEGREPKE